MHAQLQFATGAAAERSPYHGPAAVALIVVSDEGKAQLPVPWKPDLDGPNGIELSPARRFHGTITFEPVDPYLCEVEAMEACVLDGADPSCLTLSREFLTSVLGIYAQRVHDACGGD
ncbi:MAG: hypothetical protein R3A10_05550 [Caldilineaceae bacterium]